MGFLLYNTGKQGGQQRNVFKDTDIMSLINIIKNQYLKKYKILLFLKKINKN